MTELYLKFVAVVNVTFS